MTAKRITDLTEDTNPQSADLLVTVDDPSGTASNKKVTVQNLTTANIKQYGALVDPADSTAAIVAAVAASARVYVPTGNYLTTTDPSGLGVEFYGPGTIEYTGGATHPEIIGSLIHGGDYRNIGGEGANATRHGGFLVGGDVGKGGGLLISANEHPHWQIWRCVNVDSSDDGTLHWDVIPNIPFVNAKSATHNGGTDTKLTKLTRDFSDSEIWVVGQLIQFNLVKYRIKARIDNDNIVLGTDALTPLAVAWTSEFTDNVCAPRFVWNVTGTISGDNLAITAGDHPPSFASYDYTNNRVYALISGSWIRVTASVTSTSLTLASSPGDATGATVKIRLEPDYTWQLGFKRASGSGIEETLRIESHNDGYMIRAAGGANAVSKPIYFEMEDATKPMLFMHGGGELYGFGTKTPDSFFDLEDKTANANINIRMTNDVQTWTTGLAGTSEDRWIVRDVSGNNDIIFIDKAATLFSIGIRSNRVEIGVPLIHEGTPQTLTGEGAVNTTTSVTHIVTTGTDALTLGDATDGQIKYIIMKTDGGVGTLTPSNLGNGSTITFDDVGDSAHLLFTNSAWHFMGGSATLA